MFLQKCFQSLHCPAAGGDQEQKTAGSLFFGHMGDHRIKQIGVFLLALGGKAASGSAREVFSIGVFKRSNAAPAYIVHALRPFCIKQIKRLRRQRFDDAPPVAVFHIGLHGLMAGLIIIGNLLMALFQRCFGLVIGDIKRAFAMIEQRLQRVVKQWKPMLHSLMARAIANGGVKRVFAHHRAESLHIAAPKTQNGFLIKVNFTRGRQGQFT